MKGELNPGGGCMRGEEKFCQEDNIEDEGARTEEGGGEMQAAMQGQGISAGGWK